MEQTIVNERVLQGFRQHLQDDEKSRATLDKYMRDVKRFAVFAAGRELDKGLLLAYKVHLEEHYAIRSANSMLATVNALLCFMGLCRLRVRQFRVQKEVYCSAEKELTRGEYNALIRAAEARSNCRLSLVLQTLCGAQTDVPLTMPVDCRQRYVEGIGQLCAHCAQRAAGETPNKKTRTLL